LTTEITEISTAIEVKAPVNNLGLTEIENNWYITGCCCTK